MQGLLDRLLARPSLQHARMAGAAVRGLYQRDAEAALEMLREWSLHTDKLVRIAAGVGYGVIGTRDRDSFQTILPYVAKLAHDSDEDVRTHGAQAALTQLWLVHTDAVSNLAEKWAESENDAVRVVVVRTIARIVVDGQIGRPSLLRHFIDRGMKVLERMAPMASSELRRTIAEAVDEIGTLAPELVIPSIERWSETDDSRMLRLVSHVLELPVGALCEGISATEVADRTRGLDRDSLKQTAALSRRGVGDVDYFPMLGTSFLVTQQSDHLPWAHIADPYRGCQLRCEFCNARTSSEFEGEGDADFKRRITVVQNAAQLLSEELSEPEMLPRERHVLGLGVTSDPYQPAEERFNLSRDILKTCLALQHPVVVQTRQELIQRDTDILAHLADLDLANVLIAMQTPVEGIRNKIELGTSSVKERLRTMRALSSRGIPVGLLLSPIMPDLTDDENMLEEMIRRAADAGASWVVPEVLNLHGSARTRIKVFLDSYASPLVPRYKELYTKGERPGDPDPEYQRRIVEEIVPALAEKHGMIHTSRMLTSGRSPTACLVRV